MHKKYIANPSTLKLYQEKVLQSGHLLFLKGALCTVSQQEQLQTLQLTNDEA